MKLNIAEYPGSYLVVEMTTHEKIISEKGALIYCDGVYSYENKIEAKDYKNWIAKLFGKSLTYNIYTAQDNLKLVLAPSNNAELFSVEISETQSLIFDPNAHFARTPGLELKLEQKDWKSTLNDGLKLKTIGSGILILKGYGKIIKQTLDNEKPVFIDENALIAFEETLEVKTISQNLKELFTSGEGFMYQIQGKGAIWLQSREKNNTTGSGNVVDGIFSFIR